MCSAVSGVYCEQLSHEILVSPESLEKRRSIWHTIGRAGGYGSYFEKKELPKTVQYFQKFFIPSGH